MRVVATGRNEASLRPWQCLAPVPPQASGDFYIENPAKAALLHFGRAPDAQTPGLSKELQYPLREPAHYLPGHREQTMWLAFLHERQGKGHDSLTFADPLNTNYRVLHPRVFGVSVSGDANLKSEIPSYDFYQRLGKTLAEHRLLGQHLHVVTRGGQGAMAAAALGAIGVPGGLAVGCAGDLSELNFRLDVHPEFYADEGQTRVMDRAGMTIVGPGGPETPEKLLTLARNLAQNKTELAMQQRIVLLDIDRWASQKGGMMDRLRAQAAAGDAPALDLFVVADTPEKAVVAVSNPDVPWTSGRRKLDVMM